MIQVWDLWIRVFHWSLVAIVVSNHFVNEAGGEWHEWLGYLACAWVAFRVVWGFIGPTHARFSEMLRAWPQRGRFLSRLASHLKGREPRLLTHPPVSLIVMATMLLLILALGMTGWMMGWDRFFGEEWLEELHELLSNSLLALVFLHVAGVIRESLIHRENLVGSMIHGKKRLK